MTELTTEPEPTLMMIGEIAVSQHWVSTPHGARPRHQVMWNIAPAYQVIRRRPAWSIVAALITVWVFFLGLLFLLVKEDRYVGHMVVTVTGPDLNYYVYIPVASVRDINNVTKQINEVRAMPLTAVVPLPAIEGI